MKNPPYVGPVPFGRKDAPFFAGRDAEGAELAAVIGAHCLTIFYAPSGAGKTSLLSALVIPNLECERCEVLPIGRVAGTQTGDTAKVRALRPDASTIEHRNPFAENLLAAIDPDTTVGGANSIDALKQFLLRGPKPAEDGIPGLRVLIIDQFEELFTKYPDAWPQREVLIDTIANAIDNQPSLSVVFSMREEYVPQLEPLLAKFVFRTKRRFRLPLLGHTQAAAAIREPAAKRGVTFQPDALEQQVKLLRGKSALSDRSPMLSEFVEPLTLQVVCLKIWDALPDDATEVSKDIVVEHGHLTAALEAYYDKCIRDVAAALDVKPWKVRAFVRANLIDQRNQRKLFNPNALAGAAEREAEQFIEQLDKCRILRPEVRHGETSYELSHDQFVPAILRSNASQDDPVSALLITAQRWAEMGQPVEHLLSIEQLDAARQWAAQNDPNRLAGPELSLYIARSEQAANEKLRERRKELEKRRKELEDKQQELEAKQAELETTNKQLVEKQDELKATNADLKRSRFKTNAFALSLAVALVIAAMLGVKAYRDGIENEETAAVANQQVAQILADASHPGPLVSTVLALGSIRKHRELGFPAEEARAVLRAVFHKVPAGRAFWKDGLHIDSPVFLSGDGKSAFVQGGPSDLLIDAHSLKYRSIERQWPSNAEFVAGGTYLLIKPLDDDGGIVHPRVVRVTDGADLERTFSGFERVRKCCQVSSDGSVMLLEGEDDTFDEQGQVIGQKPKVSLVSLDGRMPAGGFRPIGVGNTTDLVLSADGKRIIKITGSQSEQGPAWSVDAHMAATDEPLGHVTSWIGEREDRQLALSNDGSIFLRGFRSQVGNSGRYTKSTKRGGNADHSCSRTDEMSFDQLDVWSSSPDGQGAARWVRSGIDMPSIAPIISMMFVDDSTVLAAIGKCQESIGLVKIRFSRADNGALTGHIDVVERDLDVIDGSYVPERYPRALHLYVRTEKGIELLQLSAADRRRIPLTQIPEELLSSLSFSADADVAAFAPRGGSLINFFAPAETPNFQDDQKLLGMGCRFVAKYLSEQPTRAMFEASNALCRDEARQSK